MHLNDALMGCKIWNFLKNFPARFARLFIRQSSDGTYYGMVMSVRVSVRPSDSPSVRPSGSPSASFPHFSPTCFELKFCIWLCFTVLQIKFECRQFASGFVGVMPLLELGILEIHSSPHFSLTCFDLLSWNFAYDFVLLYYRSSSSVVNLRQFLWELCPFWNLEYWKYTVFRTFLLHALTCWTEILHVTLF